jgi:hypothetical protein
MPVSLLNYHRNTMASPARPPRFNRTMRSITFRVFFVGAVVLCLAASAYSGTSSGAALNNEDFVFSVSRPHDIPRASIRIHEVVDRFAPASKVTQDAAGDPMYIIDAPFITTRDVTSVDVVPDAAYEYFCVVLHFAPAAAQRLKGITGIASTNHMVAVYVDDRLLVVLRSIVPLESTSMFSDSYSREEALRLAQHLAP